MASTENIQIVVTAKDQASAQLKGLQGRIKSLGSELKTGIGMGFGIGLTSIAASATTAITGFVTDSIGAASSLNETLSKSKIIFGDSAGELEAWASTAATAFGQSKQQALDTASGFAGLFQTVGLAADKAKGYAKDLTVLGSDLASFFDTDVQTAIDSLKSGLSGEAEPLKKFNVFLSETAVSAKAVELGFKKVNGQFTEAEKVQARYALIMQQTSAAHGDFARTSDGLANSSRALDAEVADFQAELGQALLPAMKELVGVARDVIPLIKAIGDHFSEARDDAVNFAFSIAGIDGSIQTLRDYLAMLDEISEKYDVSIEDIRHWEGQHAAALDAAGTDIERLGAIYEDHFRSMAHDAERESTTLGARSIEAFINAAKDRAAAKQAELAQIGAFVAEEVTDRYADIALEKARSATGNMVGQGVIGEMQRKINEAKAIFEASFRSLGGSMADGLRGAKDSVKSAMDDLLYVINHPLKMEKETARVEAALTSKNLLKGLSSENPAIKAQAEQTKARLVELWQQLTGIAWTESNETSDNLHTGLKADYPAIRSEARDLVRDLNSIYGGVRLGNTGSTTGRNNTTRPGRRRRQRASGGPVSEGETYLVGERGPELLTMGRSGHVTPNHRMGGAPIVVNVDGRELFRIMDTRMGRQMALASTADYTRS